MKTPSLAQSETLLARSVAAEDLARGDYVAILSEVVELPSFLWNCDSHSLPPDEPVRIVRWPDETGEPLRVESICLPFVLVKHPAGRSQTLDVRQCRLAKLSRGYAKSVRKAMRPKKRSRRR